MKQYKRPLHKIAKDIYHGTVIIAKDWKLYNHQLRTPVYINYGSFAFWSTILKYYITYIYIILY